MLYAEFDAWYSWCFIYVCANPVSDQRCMFSERVHETKNGSSLLNSLSNSDTISLPLHQLKEKLLLPLTSSVVKGLSQSPCTYLLWLLPALQCLSTWSCRDWCRDRWMKGKITLCYLPCLRLVMYPKRVR